MWWPSASSPRHFTGPVTVTTRLFFVFVLMNDECSMQVLRLISLSDEVGSLRAVESMMSLVLSGSDLTIEALVAAASNKECKIEIAPSSFAKMKENREFAERVAQRGDEVYGLSGGAGQVSTKVNERRFLPAMNRDSNI